MPAPVDTLTKEKTMAVLNLWAGATSLIVIAMIAAGAVKDGVMNAFWIPAAMAVLFVLHRILNKGKLSREMCVLLIAILFLEMIIAHWYVGRELKITYAGDESARLLDFGKYLASAGEEGAYDRAHFVHYPYLYGSGFVLSLYYRAANLITGSFTEDGLWILNQFCVDSAIALAVVYGWMLGREMGIPALGLRIQILCLLSPCYYLFQNLVCLETLGMPLLIGGMVLTDWVLRREQAEGKKAIPPALLVGVYWGLTCLITPMGYLFGAAWLLTAFHRMRARTFGLWAGTAVGAAVVVMLLFTLLLGRMDLQTTQDIQQGHLPASYWLMVGLEPDGETKSDISQMDKLDTLTKRNEATWKTIAARAKKLGLPGMIENSFHKVTASGWQTGLFGKLENVDGSAYARAHDSVLDQVIGPKGLYTYSFIRYANVLWIVTLLGAAAAYPMAMIRRRLRHSDGLLASWLALFGILLTGMLTQSKPRYVLEIAPVAMVMSSCGFALLAKLPETIKTWNTTPVCEKTFFTELEADVEKAILEGDYHVANRRMKLYTQMMDDANFLLDTTGFLQFENKRKALQAKVEALNARNHQIEKIRTFLEIWGNVNSCTARELTTAKRSGDKLMQELAQYNEDNAHTLDGIQQQMQQKMTEIQKRLTALQPNL